MVQHVEQTIVFRYFDMRSVCNTSLQRYSQLFYRDIYFDTPCISEKVGHSNLILGTGVKVTYMCHISHTNLKSIEKCRNVPPFTE